MRVSLSSDAGDTLMEVVISALVVGLIVVGTLTGFSVVNRASADQRHHSQASLLASQSQEQLRSDPATALDALESAPHTYTHPVEGTTYTITQEAQPIGSSGTTSGCSVSNATAQTGAYIQIASSVTWPQLKSAKRTAVKQSTLITPPTGSDLEVDVENGATPPAGVSGVTASAKFTPEEGGSTTIEGTTGAAGCVVFTGIPATSAIVSIAEKPGFVTPNGTLKVPAKEVKIAPNITTHYPVTYNEAGKIKAEFTYNGKPEFEGKIVRSDTFTAYNVKIPAEPKFEVGSPEFEYKAVSGEEQYKALTTVISTEALTPHGTTFSHGDLFPFSEKWQVYAGDCPANSIEAATAKTEKLVNPNTLVEPGQTGVVKVPLSYVTLNVRKGTAGNPGVFETKTYPVTITDTECASVRTPNNAFAANLKHTQNSNSEGHLTTPFQPFGAYELCLSNTLPILPIPKRTYTALRTNSTIGGSSVTIFPEELPKAERETQEASTRATWKKEQEVEHKITLAERTTKEAKQTTERAADEPSASGYIVEAKSSC
jgi:Tfp pilus assembly protein PilV